MESEFGERVHSRRKSLKISQEELAQKVGYKNKSSISFIETGRSDIPLDKVSDFARALDTCPEYLIGLIDNPDWQPPIPGRDPREEIHKMIDQMSDENYNALLTILKNMNLE